MAYKSSYTGEQIDEAVEKSVRSDDIINIVKLTQAEYDALPVVQGDTMYIISEV